ARKIGPSWLRWSRPAGSVASIPTGTLPTFFSVSSISGQTPASTSSSPGTGPQREINCNAPPDLAPDVNPPVQGRGSTANDWARIVVDHWHEWTHGFWVWMFDLLEIHLTPDWTQVLSFLLFWSLLTVGEAVKYDKTVNYDTFKLPPNFRKHLVFRTNFFT